MKALISKGDILINPSNWVAIDVVDSVVHPGRKIGVAGGMGFELTTTGVAQMAAPDGAYGQFLILGKDAYFPETQRVAAIVVTEE